MGALIEIPLSKMFMDKVFPVFIPNVTSGINLAFPWYAYVIIFAGVMAAYFIITSILVRKLGKERCAKLRFASGSGVILHSCAE